MLPRQSLRITGMQRWKRRKSWFPRSSHFWWCRLDNQTTMYPSHCSSSHFLQTLTPSALFISLPTSATAGMGTGGAASSPTAKTGTSSGSVQLIVRRGAEVQTGLLRFSTRSGKEWLDTWGRSLHESRTSFIHRCYMLRCMIFACTNLISKKSFLRFNISLLVLYHKQNLEESKFHKETETKKKYNATLPHTHWDIV